LSGADSGVALGQRPAVAAAKIAFSTAASNLVTGFSDQNAAGADTYVWDRGSDVVKLMSHVAFNPTRGGNMPAGGTLPASTISADGSLVVHTNASNTLVPGSTVTGIQVFAYDTRTAENSLISHVSGNPLSQANGLSCCGYESADGRFVSFISNATDLFSPFADGNGAGVGDSFLIDRTGSPAPVVQTPPVIDGTVAVGGTLTCSPGTWSEDPTFTYSWQRGATQVATGPSYVLTADDVSRPVRCVVIATTFGGPSVAASDAVTVPPTGPAGAQGASGSLGWSACLHTSRAPSC